MKNLLIIISVIILLISFGCKKSESIQENVMFYPNSFTPNGDGLNDVWGPRGVGINGNKYLMRIFNKKDKLLFETNKFYYNFHENGWDGEVNGEPCPVDYYYYVVKYETTDGVKHKDEGMFQLIM